jgi:hypothetical protein
MKTMKFLMLLVAFAAMAAGTTMASAMPFDSFSDVHIEYTGTLTYFGSSVANAGDLNNDGYADLVIGAPDVNEAFVYFGGPSFDSYSDVDIADHTGGATSFGKSVANAGDLDNDGYTDLVVGKPDANKAFVYFGGPSFDGYSDVDIDDHTGEASFGSSVANAGDLNNDGYADLVIGAPDVNKAFVYYGGPSFDGNSNVDIADHTVGVTSFGSSVANAGDLNNDGYADLVVGKPDANKAFVYFGGPSFDGNSDVTIDDHTGEDSFGKSVANAGDLDNDGYTDLVICSSTMLAGTFVYYGGPSFDGYSDVDIADHFANTAVANAGDLNNDGYTDLVIGRSGYSDVFVYYGPLSSAGQVFDYLVKMPKPTIVTLQGKLTTKLGKPIPKGSLKVKINDSLGNLVWFGTFNDCLSDGVFNIPLGAVVELRLIPGNIYQMVIEIDVDSATFAAADVTFGDKVPAGDVIKFSA